MVAKQFPFYLVLLFSWLMINQVASDIPTAKNGCDSYCGNFSIPFPFGIKQGCFLDEWFEIICQNDNSSNTIPKPILNRTKLEVIEISVEGTLQVRNPITFLNCSDKQIRESANLEGSPFKYSQNTKFAAVGCGAIALMNSDEASIGCSSICNNKAYGNSCNGINCCQITIPSNLRSFNTSFLNLPGKGSGNQCKFAFMADQQWLESDSTNISAIQDMVDVPVELNWELYNYSTYDIFGSFVETNSTGSSEYNCSTDIATSEYGCYANSSCDVYIVNVNHKRLQCTCGSSWDFEGNPYLLEGCKDIDHCKKDPNLCGEGYICTDYPGGVGCSLPVHKKFPLKEILIGLASGLGALFLLAGSRFLYMNIKKRKGIKQKENFFKQLLQEKKSLGEVNINQKTMLFKAKELDKATNHFNVNRILGQGGQGTVYKGMLEDGNIVAVKKSRVVDERKFAEFINEVVILSQLNHRNVVKLLGCCLESESPLLVYEFIPNGTLSHYIHEQNDEFPFTWEMRLRIATEVAAAISYLHYAVSCPIYHRDIKSTNILLDEKYRAKVADFGTSRSVSIDQTHLTTLVHGTFGYLDPEYFQSSQFTEKSDVYSFGVVLVELLTGQKAISIARSEEGRNLATYFMFSMQENVLFDILDAQVLVGRKDEIMVVADLARRCLNSYGKLRPNMKQVLMELEGIHKLEKDSGTNDVPKHFEEVRDFINGLETDEVFNAISMSMESNLDAGSASTSNELPLLTSKLSKHYS